MKSSAYPASRMNPKYQLRKKIVAGNTKRLRLAINSLNSGDRSAASQSISEWRSDPGSDMSSPLTSVPTRYCPARSPRKHSSGPRVQRVAAPRDVGAARGLASLSERHDALCGQQPELLE